MKDEAFDAKLSEREFAAWSSFKAAINRFLGNNRQASYVSTVSELLENYKNVDCRMSLKLHFLNSHLDFFPQNLGAASDEQGACFYQDILKMGRHYQGRWDPAMMNDYCWFLFRETYEILHKQNFLIRQSNVTLVQS